MPDLATVFPDLLLIWSGIVVTHWLVLYSEFHSDSQGYMWPATRKIWYFLATVFAIEIVIAALAFYIGLSNIHVCPRVLLAILTGILVALIPSALESVLLPADSTGTERLLSALTKLLLKLNITIRYKFAWAMTRLREQDVYDCQAGSDNVWGLGIPSRTLRRKLRIIYELRKRDIAIERRDPAFLRYDVGRSPWEKFYLLVRLVGREGLRQAILNPPPSPCLGWCGSERRRIRGTRANRRGQDQNSDSRCYDDPNFKKRIREGKER